jgi:hypothetical protein
MPPVYQRCESYLPGLRSTPDDKIGQASRWCQDALIGEV